MLSKPIRLSFNLILLAAAFMKDGKIVQLEEWDANVDSHTVVLMLIGGVVLIVGEREDFIDVCVCVYG